MIPPNQRDGVEVDAGWRVLGGSATGSALAFMAAFGGQWPGVGESER
jgi:hypothetical protein